MNGAGISTSGGAKTEAGSGTGWSSSKIVGLASPLVKTPKIAEPLVKMSGFPESHETRVGGEISGHERPTRPILPSFLWLSDASLAAPSPCVVADVGNWSAPCVMAALAGAVHDRQGAACTEHNHREDDQQGGLHGDLATAGPPEPAELSWFK
jgi:hypothetical protein